MNSELRVRAAARAEAGRHVLRRRLELPPPLATDQIQMRAATGKLRAFRFVSSRMISFPTTRIRTREYWNRSGGGT
jgi:hypothetical protein